MTTTLTNDTPIIEATNLIGNPKALNDTSGWSVWFGAGVAQSITRTTYTSSSVGMPAGGNASTGAAIFGPAAASATPSWCALGLDTSAAGVMTANAKAAAVTPGQTYTLAAIYDCGTLPASVGLDVEWFNASGARISGVAVTAPGAPSTGWNLLHGSAVAPAGAAFGAILLYFPNGVPAAMNGHMTGAVFAPGASLPQTYFDGDYANAAWLGATNESASVLYAPEVSVSAHTITGYSASAIGQSIVHSVLGAAFPDVTLQPGTSRCGTITYLFTNVADAIAAQSLHQQPVVVTLTTDDPAQAAMSYVVGTNPASGSSTGGNIVLTQDPVSLTAWTLAVDFVEVSP